MIGIIDYGLGNVFSLASSLSYLGLDSVLTSDQEEIHSCDRLILPGVGAFGDAMDKLRSQSLIPLLRQEAATGKPLLGVCLGMQLLFERGYEYGCHEGLGLLPGQVVSMAEDFSVAGVKLKLPHMGWNALRINQPGYPLLSRTPEGSCVYFVHSYYATGCQDVCLATAEYGLPVTAAVGRENVCGCQFHPEKSGAVGLDILRAFAAM